MQNRSRIDARLNEAQRRFLDAFLARFPELAGAIQLKPCGDNPTLLIDPPPPSPRSPQLQIWLDPADEESISLGGWHTHGEIWRETGAEGHYEIVTILDFLAEILEDRTVLLTPRDKPVLLADREHLLLIATDPDEPETLTIRSWSGRLDGPLEAFLT